MQLFHSFLWLSSIPLCICTISLFICLWELGCFHVLAVVNSAAINTGMHVSFWLVFLFGYLPRSRVAQSYGSSIFDFLRNLHIVLHSGASTYIPTNSGGGFPSPHPLQLPIVTLMSSLWKLGYSASLFPCLSPSSGREKSQASPQWHCSSYNWQFLLCPSSAFSASGWITLTSFCVSSLPLFFRALIIFISFSTINDFKAPWKYKGCLNNKSLFWQMILRHLKRKN